jgi:sarcosine oxidase subunit alpha
MRDYLVNWGVSVGDRVVVVTNNDDAYRTALAVHRAGLLVPVIVDARPRPTATSCARPREAGIRIEAGRGIGKVKGRRRVTGVSICALAGEGATLEEIACDAVAMSGRLDPLGPSLVPRRRRAAWDDARAMFLPDPAARPATTTARPW